MSEEEKIEQQPEDDRLPTTDEGEKSIEGNSHLSEENKAVYEENIELSTYNIQPDNENMEVHKHPHHITPQKNGVKTWGSFLRLFLQCF